MWFRFACALALLTFACDAPSFGIAPVDPCVDQMSKTSKTCGGACPACDLGASCEMAADCLSTICTEGVCVPPPSCTDQQQNGDETDVDCGGSCPSCALGKSCETANDCASTVCTGRVCVPAPSCTDKKKNGDETDVDCGGSCPMCAVNEHCSAGSDCESLVCASVCQPPNCKDGVRNGTETAVDCGGSCTGCAAGASCSSAGDCMSGNCNKGTCLAGSCSDRLKNGDETDVDCGGSCTPCSANQACLVAADCDSDICGATRKCTAASCTDSVKNGRESDVDCGPGCTPCKVGLHCTVGTDCASSACTQNTCVPSKPAGSVLLRSGWIATATASSSTTKPGDALDGDRSTRWNSGTGQAIGMFYEIDMLKSQIFFGMTLDIADTPGDGANQFDVYLSNDGTFTTPALTAQASDPTTGIATVTFPSAQIARYIKLVLTGNKASNWWAIQELNVTD